MIHRTFRSLDDAPKLVGFTLRQWATLIAGASVVLGVVYVAHLPARASITLCVFVIGLPAALTYVSESGGLHLGVLLRDMWRWRSRAKTFAAPAAGDRCGRGLHVVQAVDEPVVERPGTAPPVGEGVVGLWERWE